MTIVLRECTPEDTEALASVLAPAFENWVNVMVGDMEKAMRIIPGIIASMDGGVPLKSTRAVSVAGFTVTLSTTSRRESEFSIVFAHIAHVIPPIFISSHIVPPYYSYSFGMLYLKTIEETVSFIITY